MARKMKDSGVQWIGEVPAHWEMRKLKYILHERNEKNDPVKTNEILSLTAAQGVIPYAEKEGGGNKPKEDLTAYKLAYPNDIVMNSMNVLSGSVDLSRYFGCVSPVYYMLYSDDSNINIKYYNYIFKTKTFQRSLMGLGNGILIKESENGNLNTIRMRIPLEKLNGLLFMIPSRNEQDKIVDFLDKKVVEIDKAINKTKETIEDYKKYKQAVITEAVTKGLNPDVEMKDSGIEWIGNIPKQWNTCKIKHVFKVFSGATPKSGVGEYWDGDIIWVTPADYKTVDKYISTGKRNISQQGYDSCGTVLVPSDSIVFSKRAPIGSVAITQNELCTNQGCLSCCKKEDANIEYYYYVFSIATKEFDILGTGTTFKEISFDNFINFIVPFPLKKYQDEIVKFLNPIIENVDNLISKKEALIVDLEEYKKSLIYEYVTGKKEVPEEKVVLFPAVVNCKNKRFAQAVLLTKVLDEFGEYHSGRVKVAKTLYVLENHIGFDFEVDPVRKMAGPLDKQYYDAEAIVRHNNWFNVFEDTSNVKFFAGKDKDRYLEYYDKYFKDHDSEIQRIIDVFKNLNMNEAELLATAYASWNDFIIKGDDFNKDDIVEDIFAWDDSKKRFSKETWLGALSELEAKGLSPLGHGKITVLEKE